jgi:hypothetical protein
LHNDLLALERYKVLICSESKEKLMTRIQSKRVLRKLVFIGLSGAVILAAYLYREIEQRHNEQERIPLGSFEVQEFFDIKSGG